MNPFHEIGLNPLQRTRCFSLVFFANTETMTLTLCCFSQNRDKSLIKQYNSVTFQKLRHHFNSPQIFHGWSRLPWWTHRSATQPPAERERSSIEAPGKPSRRRKHQRHLAPCHYEPLWRPLREQKHTLAWLSTVEKKSTFLKSFWCLVTWCL